MGDAPGPARVDRARLRPGVLQHLHTGRRWRGAPGPLRALRRPDQLRCPRPPAAPRARAAVTMTMSDEYTESSGKVFADLRIVDDAMLSSGPAGACSLSGWAGIRGAARRCWIED